jgi:hypothetical protein
VLQSAMPVMSRALVPEVLPAVMPDVPAVPEMLPAPPPALALPAWLPADLPVILAPGFFFRPRGFRCSRPVRRTIPARASSPLGWA